jgi:hypothetical protein
MVMTTMGFFFIKKNHTDPVGPAPPPLVPGLPQAIRPRRGDSPPALPQGQKQAQGQQQVQWQQQALGQQQAQGQVRPRPSPMAARPSPTAVRRPRAPLDWHAPRASPAGIRAHCSPGHRW